VLTPPPPPPRATVRISEIIDSLQPVLRIRIRRIHMFLGPPGSASQSNGSGSFYHQAKIA
jgi:hypothetical protein